MYLREEKLGNTKSGIFPTKLFFSRIKLHRVLQGCEIHEYFLYNRLFPGLARGRRDPHILPRVSGALERGEHDCDRDWR